jgi:large subunit ribosomal protein L17
MRHQKAGRRLGRNMSHRKALMRNMATSLLDHEKIETTEIKAKEVRRYAEKMITLGKRGDLHARRQALSFLRSRDVVAKVFDEYAERFKDRNGGYTRIMKLGHRVGDNARMAIIEVLPSEESKVKDKKTSKEKGEKETKAKDVGVEKGKAEKKAQKEKGKEDKAKSKPKKLTKAKGSKGEGAKKEKAEKKGDKKKGKEAK